MDLRFFLTVFTTVFLAELGDKTQLATFLYASDAAHSKLTVFLGAASALVDHVGDRRRAGRRRRAVREPAAALVARRARDSSRSGLDDRAGLRRRQAQTDQSDRSSAARAASRAPGRRRPARSCTADSTIDVRDTAGARPGRALPRPASGTSRSARGRNTPAEIALLRTPMTART